MSGVYDHPKYYEIAFGFRDIPAEVDLLETCFGRFCHIPVRSVLELGCGNSPHMEELVKRGYHYRGIDLSEAMLAYSREKAERSRAEVELIHADMNEFTLDEKVDFVFVLLGSLITDSTQRLHSHFDSVARALTPGGLYLLDWCVQYESPFAAESVSWEMERDGICVTTTVSWKAVNQVEQTFEEKIHLDVNDNGKTVTTEGVDVKRAIYPQEFLLLIDSLDSFEFVGWWNNWDLDQPLVAQTKVDRPVAIIRRV